MSGLAKENDLSKVRTPEDVERKYNLGRLSENLEINENTIINLENELNNFIDVTYTNEVNNLQGQIDGKVETWYYSGIPSLSNLPASDWTTDEEKSKHIGDLYYNQATGYVYRFTYENNLYTWQEIHDEKAVDALSIANAAQDTADSKRRIFTSQPTPPYDNGDLWVQGSTGDIKACQVARQEGSYVATDWILASKYTDNTYATAIVDEMGGTTTTVLSGQVVTIMNNYTKFTDLSTGGSSTIAGDNITTGTIKSNNYIADTSGTKIELLTGAIDSKNFKVDSTGTITSTAGSIGGFNMTAHQFLSNLTGLYNYNVYDLMSMLGFLSGKIYVSSATENVYDINDSGSVDSADLLKLIRILNGQETNTKTATGTLEINTSDPKYALVVKNSDNVVTASMGVTGIASEMFTGRNAIFSKYNDSSAKPIIISGETGTIEVNGYDISNVYSTTEKAIGRWIDDSIVYRKVIEVNASVGSSVSIQHYISNFKTIIDHSLYVFNENDSTCYTEGNSIFPIQFQKIDGTNIYLSVDNGFVGWKIRIIIDYIKSS